MATSQYFKGVIIKRANRKNQEATIQPKNQGYDQVINYKIRQMDRVSIISWIKMLFVDMKKLWHKKLNGTNQPRDHMPRW